MSSQVGNDTSGAGSVSVAPNRLADTFSSLMPDGPIEIREGYADVGDQTLALRRGRRWAAARPVARLPGVLVRLAAPDPAARGGGLSGGRPRHAWVQPVIEARGIRGVRRRPARRRHPRSHQRAWCRVRASGRSRLGRIHRLDHRDESSGGRRPTRHPQRGPSAAALGGTAPPEPAPEVLVLLLLCNTGTARGRGARQRLALLPTLPRRRGPALHAAGDRTLRRGVVAARGRRWDDQLLPRLGAAVPEGSRSEAAPNFGADAGHLG